MEKQLLSLLDYDLDFDEEEACKFFAPFMDRMSKVLPTPGQKETRAAAIQAVSKAGKARAKTQSTSQSPESTDDVSNPPPKRTITSTVRCIVGGSNTSHRNVLLTSGNLASDFTPSPTSSPSMGSCKTDSGIGTLVDGKSTSFVSINSIGSEPSDKRDGASTKRGVLRTQLPGHIRREWKNVSSPSVKSRMASQGGDGSDRENTWPAKPETSSFRPATRLNGMPITDILGSCSYSVSDPLWTVDLGSSGDDTITRECVDVSTSDHVRAQARNVMKCRAGQDKNRGESPLPAGSTRRSPAVFTSTKMDDITNQPHATSH
ncbi:hypothetical protein F5141DRAFT_122110 [Pisolithus sp. B1]|nr:hypothetical protein F5141DRAFT_122110 [Pisolithus sp. B1]